MTLGQQIRQARENKNLSQEELASKMGVSRQAVSKWENNSAIPQGLNREMLVQVLEMDFSVSEAVSVIDVPSKKHIKSMWLGWGLAAVLFVMLCVSVGIGLHLFSLQENIEIVESEDASEAVRNDGTAETVLSEKEQEIDNSPIAPAIKRVQFYDSDQNIVTDVALWYNAAEIDSILIQWEGGTPNSIKTFFTPGGTEAQEQTELLLTKSIPDGDTAALLNANVLEEIDQGHVYFELDFGETIVTSEDFNIIYNADLPMEVSQVLVYIRSIDGRTITADPVEWIDIPSDRARELGIEDNEAGNMVYNEEETLETFVLAKDCNCAVRDWSKEPDSDDVMHVTLEELLDILAEREGIETPYLLTIEGDEVVWFGERSVE